MFINDLYHKQYYTKEQQLDLIQNILNNVKGFDDILMYIMLRSERTKSDNHVSISEIKKTHADLNTDADLVSYIWHYAFDGGTFEEYISDWMMAK